MQIEEIKRALIIGEWVSFAPEVRPSIIKTASGDIKPLYCSRRFFYPEADRFELDFTNYADPYAEVPLVLMHIKGHVNFGQPHRIAQGAYDADYIADAGFSITPLNSGLVAALNAAPQPGGLRPWELNVAQDVLGKTVPAFGLKAGEYFTEYDLIFIHDNLLFNGSRNVDGRPFDKPANRPTNLQVPLIRK